MPLGIDVQYEIQNKNEALHVLDDLNRTFLRLLSMAYI